MARKSRKNLPQPEQAAASMLLPELEEAKMPAAIYGRLSVEDKPQTAPRRIRGCVCSLCGPFQFSLLLRKNVKFRDWQVWPLILSPCG